MPWRYPLDPSAAEIYAELYDASEVGWPGEMDCYHALAVAATARGESVLEVACGTGRVAIPLAQDEARVTGLDHSAAMLRVAREKSREFPNVRWVEADMRSFALGEAFGLILIPAHSFQSMVTPEDQVACLGCVWRHLTPGGTLVVHLDHQDLDWLGSLPGKGAGNFEEGGEVVHPRTGRLLRHSFAWGFERASQTATLTLAWEEIGSDGGVATRWELGPTRLHCAFRFEVDHLLARTGFEERTVYGDFLQQELRDDSAEMIWVAQKALAA
jgi:SAM-dependent methyltransferase